MLLVHMVSELRPLLLLDTLGLDHLVRRILPLVQVQGREECIAVVVSQYSRDVNFVQPGMSDGLLVDGGAPDDPAGLHPLPHAVHLVQRLLVAGRHQHVLVLRDLVCGPPSQHDVQSDK